MGRSIKFDVSTVRALLEQRLATPIEVIESQRLMPWFVVRCRLAGQSSEVPASVIVKVLRQDPNGFRTDLRQVYTERAALEFVGALDPESVPHLWASDPSAGILIMEDLAPRIPLAAVLRTGDSAECIAGLRRFARALGRLAAVTVGHESAYQARHRDIGRFEPDSHRRGLPSGVWERTRGFMSALDAAPSGAAESDLARAMSELTEPGPFQTPSSGDAGPNNYLVSKDDGRVIDFEAAGYRHAVEDAVCLYVPVPHWLTAGDPIAEGLEAEYRASLAETIPEAMDDTRFGGAVAAACLVFAIFRLHRFPKLDAAEEGDPGRLQVVSTLEVAARTAATHRSLPHLRSWVRETVDALRRHWPDVDVDLDTFPPHTPRWQEQPTVPVATDIGS